MKIYVIVAETLTYKTDILTSTDPKGFKGDILKPLRLKQLN